MPTPGRAEEEERADRPVRVGETRAGAADRVRDRGDRDVLTDHALVHHLFHAHELLHLALEQPRHGDAGPAGDDLGDVVGVDLLLQHLLVALELVEALRLRGDLGVELAHRAVPQLGRALEVALALGALGLVAGVLEPLLQLADLGDRVLLGLPARDHPVALLGELGELGLDRVEPLLRAGVGRGPVELGRERGLLDLQLADAPLDHVDLERHRVDLDPEAGRGLVDEVDRLVGELAAGDVAVAEHRRGRRARRPGCARRGGPRSAP